MQHQLNGRSPGTVPLAHTVLAVLAGLAFAAFPLLRPWGDTAGGLEETARAFADPRWVISHLSGMLGWVLLTAAAAARGPVGRAGGLLAVGTAAMLPYYGAETFSLHVLGSQALREGDLSMLALEELIRAEPTAQSLFGIGLLTAAVGAVVLARQCWQQSRIRWAGVPLAVLVSLYLPQFFAPDAVRVLHGVLLGAACVGWAAAMKRGQSR